MLCPDTLPIAATRVPLDERMDFLPESFGSNLMMIGENAVYNWMTRLAGNYGGGSWHFYRLSNGGFYMAPDRTEDFKVEVFGNYYIGVVSPDAAGIIATLFALGQMAGEIESDSPRLVDAYHLLREYALSHPEWREIVQAID